jgi:hypothetical protein
LIAVSVAVSKRFVASIVVNTLLFLDIHNLV